MSARLAVVAACVTDPGTTAALYRVLGFDVADLGQDSAEVRFADGLIIRLLRGPRSSRLHLGIRVRDVTATAGPLTEAGIAWSGSLPGTLSNPFLAHVDLCDPDNNRVYVVGLSRSVDAPNPNLIAATHFVADLASSVRFYRSLGFWVSDADFVVSGGPDPYATVNLVGNAAFMLWPKGDGPPAPSDLVIQVEDVRAAARGLDNISWQYEWDRGALVTNDPDGCAVRLLT